MNYLPKGSPKIQRPVTTSYPTYLGRELKRLYSTGIPPIKLLNMNIHLFKIDLQKSNSLLDTLQAVDHFICNLNQFIYVSVCYSVLQGVYMYVKERESKKLNGMKPYFLIYSLEL